MKPLFQISFVFGAVSLTAGVCLVFGIKITDIYHRLFRRGGKRQTLKEKVRVITGEAPKNLFKREYYNAERLLKKLGKEKKFRQVKVLSLFFAFLGLTLAIFLHNAFLAPVLAIAAGGAPFIYIKIQARRYKRAVDDALESTISLITTSYLRNDSLIAAVQENLAYLPLAVASYFQEFVTEATLINANTVTAINNLQMKINNQIFHEWCRGLVLCQEDSSMKQSLQPVVRKFSDKRVIQADLDAELHEPQQEMYIVMALTLLTPALLYLLNPGWGTVLFTTSLGKLSLAVTLSVSLYLFLKTTFFTEQVDFRGGDGG